MRYQSAVRLCGHALSGARGIAIALLVFDAAGTGPAFAAIPPQDSVTAFVGVAVIPMDRERVLPGQTVLIQGQRIIKIGPAAQVPVPATATRIDGEGKFLLPGLADMHVHLLGVMAPVESFQDSVLLMPDAMVRQILFSYLAQGVTTVRDQNSPFSFLALRDRVTRGELIGPQIYTAFRPIACPETQPAVQCIEKIKAAGYDFAKLYAPDIARFDTMATAARRVGLRINGHVPRGPNGYDVEAALRGPYASIEHLYGYPEYLIGKEIKEDSTPERVPVNFDSSEAWLQPGYRPDPAKMRAIVEATRRAGTWNTPTIRIMNTSGLGGAWWAKHSALASRVTQLYRELRQALIKALHAAGAGLLLGTDGQEAAHELHALTAVGLTPYQALEIGTRNAAVFLGTLAQTGTIEVGKVADLVLLNGNPLEDICYTAKPLGVMVRGRWFTREELMAGASRMYAPRGRCR